MKYLILLSLVLVGCQTQVLPREAPQEKEPPAVTGSDRSEDVTREAPNQEVDEATLSQVKDYVVRARLVTSISAEHDPYAFLKNLVLPKAYASSSSSVISYTNASAVTFSVNTTTLLAGTTTGDLLSLGSAALIALSDNDLKVCGPMNNQKCEVAVIRMYTTGSVAGFIHTVDTYGLPVHAGQAPNPVGEVGLAVANALIVQSYAIPNNKHKIKLVDFPSPTYNVNADVANAGAGNYSMQLVIEYALGL